MPFWWVNHNQTFKEEFEGGYIWSPQRKKNGDYNEGYFNMTRVAIGDTIFSYSDTEIQAVGRITAACEPKERPEQFGAVGEQWDKKGWMVRVQWNKLSTPFNHRNYLNEIAPLLSEKHSPIRKNGDGNQGIYLASIGDILGETLLSLIDRSNAGIIEDLKDFEIILKEELLEKEIIESPIPETTKIQLRKARIGQGLFRQNVEKLEAKCRLTGVENKRLLIASHIKPWRASDNTERLDGHNGLLLSPHIDKLFDQGMISFATDGTLLISSQKILPILALWHISPQAIAGAFTDKQKRYLDYHQKHVFEG